MTQLTNLSRRDFLKAGAGLTGALVLGFKLGCAEAEQVAPGPASEQVFNPNAWLEINSDGKVIINVPWSELGQGVLTAMSMLLAEELEADWSSVEIRKAWTDPRFGRMGTGGSRSIRTSWIIVRNAGAAARMMLESAAAARWGVPVAEVHAADSMIIHDKSGQKLSFGDVAAEAAKLDVPKNVPLKDKSQHRLIGHSIPRIDSPDKVTGRALFGCDHRFEGMVRAVLARCPVFGGKLKSFDPAAALAVPGVSQVVEISNGVAVVADSTWAALQGRDALEVVWDEGPHAGLSSADISALFAGKRAEDAQVMRKVGDFSKAHGQAATKVEAVYELPFLSHSPMEPMNCTAWIEGDRCEVWVPTQSVSWAQSVAAEAAGLPAENVRVQPTYAGGGFGRRLMVGYVQEAVEIAKATGQKVQLFWTREETTQQGYCRPASRHSMMGALGENGLPVTWSHHLACPSISGQLNPDNPVYGRDEGAVDGAITLPYGIDNLQVLYSMANTPVTVCWLRSVYNTQNALANECFLDELAHAAGQDPVQYRLDLLPKDSRLRGTLELAAKTWGWPRKLPAGHGQGVASHSCFGSHVTNIAEISTEGGKMRVHKVLCVVDCGPVVHPDGMRAQMEGATVLALSALLNEEITIQNGRTEQSNFDDYPPLRLDQMPEVEVVAVDSEDHIGGIGEPGYPAVGPSVLNALFNATGTRVRNLPVAENFKG